MKLSEKVRANNKLTIEDIIEILKDKKLISDANIKKQKDK